MIIPEASPEVYSPMSLVELVRGAVSSTQQQQNTAAPHPTIIGRLAQGIELSCALVTKKPDLPNLDHDAEKDVEGGQAEVQQNLIFGERRFPNFNCKINSDKSS